MIALARRSELATHPALRSTRQRAGATGARGDIPRIQHSVRDIQTFVEGYGDWVGLAYRGVLYTLAATPFWGAGLIVAIVWHRIHLS